MRRLIHDSGRYNCAQVKLPVHRTSLIDGPAAYIGWADAPHTVVGVQAAFWAVASAIEKLQGRSVDDRVPASGLIVNVR